MVDPKRRIEKTTMTNEQLTMQRRRIWLRHSRVGVDWNINRSKNNIRNRTRILMLRLEKRYQWYSKNWYVSPYFSIWIDEVDSEIVLEFLIKKISKYRFISWSRISNRILLWHPIIIDHSKYKYNYWEDIRRFSLEYNQEKKISYI